MILFLKEEEVKIPIHVKFPIAALSAMAASVFGHPQELLKTRLQLSNVGETVRKTPLEMIREVVRNEGYRGFYTGFTAALLRQATYGATRVATYMILMDNYDTKYHTQPDFPVKLFFGFVAGATGSTLGTPSEIIFTRMTADALVPFCYRRNYSNALNALFRIYHEEGIQTLWRGYSSTVGRAVVANSVEFSVYSQFKGYLLQSGHFIDNFTTHVLSSAVAAFGNVATSLPIDMAKTRIQNMQIVNGKAEYTGPFDVIIKVIRNEGITALWKGFWPCFACIGPRTILIFVFVEHLCQAYSTIILKNTTNTGSSL